MQLDGGVVRLHMAEIKKAYPNVRELVGNSIYVKASVLTKSGNELCVQTNQSQNVDVDFPIADPGFSPYRQ